jgi:hypothetical protein
MKLDEDYDYVWFPNLIRVQLRAVKFWIMASSALYGCYSYAQRDMKQHVQKNGCPYALTDIKEDVFMCTWDGFWYVLIKHLYPSHSYDTWHIACKLYVWEDLWWAVL